LAEQVEPGAAVHGSFEQLQLVDLPFSLTVAPRQGECGADGSAVMLEACCKGHDGTDAAVARVSEPCIEGIDTRELPRPGGPCITDKIDEPSYEPDECRRLAILLDARDRLGFLDRPRFGCLDDELGDLDGRKQLPCCRQRGRGTWQDHVTPAAGRMLVECGPSRLKPAPDLFCRAGKAQLPDLAPQLRAVLAAFAYPQILVVWLRNIAGTRFDWLSWSRPGGSDA